MCLTFFKFFCDHIFMYANCKDMVGNAHFISCLHVYELFVIICVCIYSFAFM